MDLHLNSFGVNHLTIQEEYLKWLLNKSAACVAQETSENNVISMVEIVEKCLPFIGNITYSSLWTELLDKISTLTHRTEVLHLYEKINQEILKIILKGDLVPLSVVLHLWQTNLLSLEFIVVNIVHHLALGLSPLEQILEKNVLIQACHHEPMICHVVQHMLKSLPKHAHLTTIVMNILNTLTKDIQEKS